MNTARFTSFAGVLLIICFNEIQAQSAKTLLRQTKDMSMISGNNRNCIKQRFNDFENFQGIISNSAKYFIPGHENQKLKQGNNVKFALEGFQKLDSIIEEEWNDGLSQWFPSMRDIYTIDDTYGNTTLDVTYGWNMSSGKWYNMDKSEYLYNADRTHCTHIDSWFIENTGKWETYTKYEDDYDSNGNNIIDIIYNWDNASSQWIPWHKAENMFDADSHLTLSIDLAWDTFTKQWNGNGSFKRELTYDVKGNCTSNITYLWDNTTLQFALYDNEQFEYNSTGKPTSETIYRMNSNTNKWVNELKFEFTYDPNGYMSTGLYKEWNDTTARWVEYGKEEQAADANGNVILWTIYTLNNAGKQWFTNRIEEYTYDVYGNYSTKIIHTHAPVQLTWLTDRFTYYYSRHNLTGIHNIAENNIDVYPNPATDFVTFKLPDISESASLEMFDNQGKKIIGQNLPESGQISLSHLRKGLYLYTITDKGHIYKGRIIIK